MNLNTLWGLLKETGSEWLEDKAPRLAAALAYYTMFSLAPLLLIAIAVAGLVWRREVVQGALDAQVQGLVGQESADAIQTMLQGASKPKAGLVATSLGLATLLFGASGVFGALQESLNTIWEVTPKPGRGVLGVLKDRFVSFTMVLGVGFLLLVALVLSAALAALGEFVGGVLPFPEVVLQGLNFVISFGVITLLFALIYKILPDVDIRWSDVWVGAAATALLFTIGKVLIGLYLGKSDVGAAYGIAGSVIVILLWVYYSALILFLGAEFTQVYANTYGSRMVPDADALPLTEEARAEQGLPHQAAKTPATAPVGGTPARREVATSKQTRASQQEQELKYKYYGVAVGAALLSFLGGLVIGAVSLIISLLVGAARRLRGA